MHGSPACCGTGLPLHALARTCQGGHYGIAVGAGGQQAQRDEVRRQLPELAVDHVQRRADQPAAKPRVHITESRQSAVVLA